MVGIAIGSGLMLAMPVVAAGAAIGAVAGLGYGIYSWFSQPAQAVQPQAIVPQAVQPAPR